jgi:hypothetical protein
LSDKRLKYEVAVNAVVRLEPSLIWRKEAQALLDSAQAEDKAAILPPCDEDMHDAVVHLRLQVRVPMVTVDEKDWPVALIDLDPMRMSLPELVERAISKFEGTFPAAAVILKAE